MLLVLKTLPLRMQIMPHKLFKLTQKLHGVPHLISQKSFLNIASYLNTRNAGFMLPNVQKDSVQTSMNGQEDDDDMSQVGVIEINGPLTYKSTGWEAECGGCSYECILEELEDLVASGCTTVVLYFDSDGGEAYGAFETGDQIRAICDKANVQLISYVDGGCCSAAYALACVADEVIINPDSEVGSIGVLISLYDNSEEMKQEGIKPIFISAGAQKIPYADDGSFKKEFLQGLQVKVDTLYDAFSQYVSKYTSISVDNIKATEAKTYMAKDALSIGLANKIMTRVDFMNYLLSRQGVQNA